MNRLDWNLLQTFVAAAKHGSLSAASKAEGITQPTASRHIAQLEDQLGYRLIERSKAGIALTEHGRELLEQAQAMAEAAARVEMIGDSQSQSLSGTVRITASRIVATFVLPEMLSQFRLTEPNIEIEVVASDETENLLHREADIAIRMFRPTQLDVISRKVSDLELGVYAAKTYLERFGEPQSFADLTDHTFIGYDRSTLILDGFRKNGIDIDREFFAFRSDDQVVCWAMVVAGFGIGFNQRIIGDYDNRLKRILRDVVIPPMPVWLTSHSALKSNRRIRRVYDYLAESFANS